MSIKHGGAITGNYFGASGAFHGFLRSSTGSFTLFDAQGAGTGAGRVRPTSINVAGAVAGSYSNASLAYHGFVRAHDGTMATFNAPGAGTGAGQGTFVAGIRSAEVITGW